MYGSHEQAAALKKSLAFFVKVLNPFGFGDGQLNKSLFFIIGQELRP